MHMKRTTLNIDEALLAKAMKFTKIKEKTELVRLGLVALINIEAQKRLAKLRGTKSLTLVRRR